MVVREGECKTGEERLRWARKEEKGEKGEEKEERAKKVCIKNVPKPIRKKCARPVAV